MKLSLVAAVWLAQSTLIIAQDCICPEGRSPCTTCVNNLVEEEYTCSQTCTTRCVDLRNDPNNCGFCGNVCPSGTCSEGKCPPDSCPGGVCGTFQLCSGNNCYCFTDAEGKGFCGLNASCAQLPDCKLNSDCPAGWLCSVQTCCGRNVCLNRCENGGGGFLSSSDLAKLDEGSSAGGAAGGTESKRL